MFYPVNRESLLRLPGSLQSAPIFNVAGNRERTLFAAVTTDTIYIVLAHPELLLCFLRRSLDDVQDKGEYRKIYWRNDSSSICVATSKNHLLVYKVSISEDNCFNFVDSSHAEYQRQSRELFMKEQRPQVHLSLAVVVHLAARATSAVALREELFVSLTNGFAHRISWSGNVDAEYSIRLSSIPFAPDQLQSKPEYVPDGIYIRNIVYAPLIGGFCVVLSDGRAALLTSPDPRFHPTSLLGVWAQHLKDAVCSDVNHKFRLLVFGCENGDICAFHLDEANGALVQAFRIALSVKDGPELLNRIGRVSSISVVQSGAAFAAIWDGSVSQEKNAAAPRLPVFAIFSPYGSQLWCSIESSFVMPCSNALYTSCEWGAEGQQMWLSRTDGLSVVPLARSASVNNSVMEHSERVCLISGSSVLLSPKRERETSASAPHAVWNVLAPHPDYITANWPIRFVCLERGGDARHLAIAGSHGLAHYNLTTGRWRIFGNENQERDMVVTGGIFIWRGTVAAACSDNEKGNDMLRFYPLNTKLDNRYCSQYETNARVVSLNVRDDYLVTFDVECRILLYKMNVNITSPDRDGYPKVAIDRGAEIRVGDLITHPACLVSIHITQLNHETKPAHSDTAMFVPGIDTVLVNVSGRLITLNPKPQKQDHEEAMFQLNQPIMVAQCVEQLWHDPSVSSQQITSGRAHLSNALWLSCGARGMRVWLPLLPVRRGLVSQDSFISKRIMLPFSLDIRPLVMCSGDCVALGVESLPSLYGNAQKDPLVLYSARRNSEVFAHHLLKQLLKRNLGVFAIEIASSIRSLAYFPHSLELLLHNVLEEEATSSEPIPDPLLPRIVAFVQEFPEFLRTVAHCARKTELALWNALFAVTSPPSDLFEVCLRDGELQTAASYLIVLQNIESPQVSQEHTARLMREALSAGEWAIARDMIRFASSIHSDDIDAYPMHEQTAQPLKSSSRRPTKSGAEADDDLVVARFQAAKIAGSRVRHTDSQSISRKESDGGGRRLSKALSAELGPPSPISPANPLVSKLHEILKEHALRLLDEYCIRDLGFLSAHLDLDLVNVLPDSSTLQVGDWLLALTRLHSQFSWPYPLASQHVVDHFAKKFSSICPSSSAANLSAFGESGGSEGSVQVERTRDELKEEETTLSDDATTIVHEARLEVAPPRQLVNGATDQVLNNNDSSSGDQSGRPVSPGSSSINTQGTPATDAANSELKGIDVLCGRSAARGPPPCEAQLKHMLTVFRQCRAIQWIFLLCIVLRDVATVRSELSVSTAPLFPPGTLMALSEGCRHLIKWAEQMCPGYLPLLQLFDSHIHLVAEAAAIPMHKPSSNGHVDTRSSRKTDNEVRGTLGRAQRIPKSGELQDSFGAPRRRERSRSVDRIHAVAVEPESSDCNIM